MASFEIIEWACAEIGSLVWPSIQMLHKLTPLRVFD